MSIHQITLVFEDGRVVEFEASEDDTIYFAALKNRVRILTDCLEGACATCKGVCTSGEYTMEEFTDEALTQDERERREVLTCQMHARSACVIEFPYESRIALKSEPETRAGRVTGIEMVSSSVTKLVVETDNDGVPISFMPGQYVHLSVPDTDEFRSYSFANGPFENGQHTFYVKLLEQGSMSDYLSGRALPGDKINITGPFGRFYLRPVVRPILMVAGGTGLAPMISMLQTLLIQNETQFPVTLLYGANESSELFALDLLEEFSIEGLDLKVERCVLNPEDGWTGRTGHITDLLRDEIMNGGDTEVYLCGPPPMVDAAEKYLADKGVEPSLVHAEKFVPS